MEAIQYIFNQQNKRLLPYQNKNLALVFFISNNRTSCISVVNKITCIDTKRKSYKVNQILRNKTNIHVESVFQKNIFFVQYFDL